MKITDYAKRRYTTKAFDPSRKIAPEIVEELLTLLRYTPSSTNSQPWHFLLVESEEAKQRVAKATSGPYAFNLPRVTDASHIVVLCAKVGLDEEHLRNLLEQEARDGRFPGVQVKPGVEDGGRRYFTDLHRFVYKDLQHWMEKQLYIALGFLLLGAASLEVDACPIEGFDARVLDEAFDLHRQGLTGVVMVSLGYRSADDPNARLPKSRLAEEAVITRL
ncbi:oxygen-insensitive NAD(P)H nitroreductase [Endothiovibrio diazotrophicus]